MRHCIVVDGVRMQVDRDPSEADLEALREIGAAARAYSAAHPPTPEQLERRQASQKRILERIALLKIDERRAMSEYVTMDYPRWDEPASRDAVMVEGAHFWVRFDSRDRWLSCRWCGMVRGRVSETRPCKGVVRVALRR